MSAGEDVPGAEWEGWTRKLPLSLTGPGAQDGNPDSGDTRHHLLLCVPGSGQRGPLPLQFIMASRVPVPMAELSSVKSHWPRAIVGASVHISMTGEALSPETASDTIPPTA